MKYKKNYIYRTVIVGFPFTGRPGAMDKYQNVFGI